MYPHPKACEAIFVLDDDNALILRVAQQAVQFGTIVVDARCDLGDFHHDLVALGGGESRRRCIWRKASSF